jgi:ankyrin repeat protein
VDKLLLEKGARIRGTGALHVAAILPDLDRMQLLLEHGSDVNEIPFMPVFALVNYHRGGTLVHWAIAGGRSEAIKLLKHHLI